MTIGALKYFLETEFNCSQRPSWMKDADRGKIGNVKFTRTAFMNMKWRRATFRSITKRSDTFTKCSRRNSYYHLSLFSFYSSNNTKHFPPRNVNRIWNSMIGLFRARKKKWIQFQKICDSNFAVFEMTINVITFFCTSIECWMFHWCIKKNWNEICYIASNSVTKYY